MGRASFPPSFLPSNLLTCPPSCCHGNKGGGSQITGSGFLPGAGPRGCPLQTHAPFTLPLRVGQQGCFSLLPPPTPVPPISWLRLSKSQPGLCLKSSHPGQDSRDRVSARAGAPALCGAHLPRSLGTRWEAGARDRSVHTIPSLKVGALLRDAPRHVPHAQWQPTEAAHHEGVGAPRSSPRPPVPQVCRGWCGLS